MNMVSFLGKDCVEIKSGDFKLNITVDCGPRILGAFPGESENLFYTDDVNNWENGREETGWKIFGGHRLWHSPENLPRTYQPDNNPVDVSEADNGITFSRGRELETGIYKEFTVVPEGNNKFEIIHKLRNEGMWDLEFAAWALTVMAPGGTAVTPQPKGDPDSLLPNRYFAVWPYTDMSDKRLNLGRNYILLHQNPQADTPCKIGLQADDGCLAYVNNGTAFIKRFEHMIDGEYPDNGCSVEMYTNDFMLEIETLSPLYRLDPGEEIVHVEKWEALNGVDDIIDEKDVKDIF